MWGYLGIVALEMLVIRTPAMVFDLTARGSIWAASKAYDWYNPTISNTQQINIEINRIKFELEELRNPEWVIIGKQN